MLGKTRIDQTKKWIINAEGPTAAIPDFVCKAHSLELFGSSETTVGGTSKIKNQRRVNLSSIIDHHGILVEAVENLKVHDEAISEPEEV